MRSNIGVGLGLTSGQPSQITTCHPGPTRQPAIRPATVLPPTADACTCCRLPSLPCPPLEADELAVGVRAAADAAERRKLSTVPGAAPPPTVTRQQKRLAFPSRANRLSPLNPAPPPQPPLPPLSILPPAPTQSTPRRKEGEEHPPTHSIVSDGPGREPGVADGERARRISGVSDGGEAGVGGHREGRGGPVGGAAAAVGADGADDGRRPGRVGVPGGGQHAPLGGHHRGLRRDGVRGHLLPPRAGLHRRIPVQAAQGAVRHPLLPPQRRRARQHLPRHPPGQVVLRLRRAHHPPLHPEPARRAEQRLAAQHAGGGALGEPGRVQEDGGEALQARGVEERRRTAPGADVASGSSSTDLAWIDRQEIIGWMDGFRWVEGSQEYVGPWSLATL